MPEFLANCDPSRAQSAAPDQSSPALRLSCVICAYNEAERLPSVLAAVAAHPAVDEIIVVDDGSMDSTNAVLARFCCVRTITHGRNLGKVEALRSGLTAARGADVLLLDADLAGLMPTHIHALIAPVLDGAAKASISVRANSLWIYRLLGLDFVSGERVVPTELVRDALLRADNLPRWGGEALINQLIVRNQLPLAVVRLPGVYNVRKHHKVGLWRGVVEELKMVCDAISVLTLAGAVRQNLELLKLARRQRPRMLREFGPPRAASPSHLDGARALMSKPPSAEAP